MMIFGDFVFTLNTAAISSLARDTKYRWGAQERFGKPEALQWLGPGTDTISLPGVVYPAFRGGAGQVDRLRTMAADATPKSLIDGDGNVYGRWIVESISETQSEFAAYGFFRKQEFALSLKHYDGGTFGGAVDLLSDWAASWL